MAVIRIRALLAEASRNIHDAKIEYFQTPDRYKYSEVQLLNTAIEDLSLKLHEVEILAKETHKQVLVREGKNPQV